MGNDFVLDRSGLLIAGFRNGLKNGRTDFEIRKLVFRNEMFHFFGDDRGFIDESGKVERGQ